MMIHEGPRGRGTLLAEHQCDLLHGDELTIYPSLDASAYLRDHGIDIGLYWVTVIGHDSDYGPIGLAEFGSYGVRWPIAAPLGLAHPESFVTEYRYIPPHEHEVRWQSALSPDRYLQFCAIARSDLNPRYCATALGAYRDHGRSPGKRPEAPPRVPVLLSLSWWVQVCNLEVK